MPDLLLKLAEQLNSSVFVLLVILVVAFWATFKLAKVISQHENFCKKQDNFDGTIDTIKEDIHAIKAKVDIIYNRNLDTVQAHSPISISDTGQKIASALKLEDLVVQYWDKISEVIKQKNPSNPYDIQVVAMALASDVFEDFFSEEEKVRIKKYAFDNGRNLLEIYPIIGVLMRDKYLNDMGISVDEIDKHDPDKDKK